MNNISVSCGEMERVVYKLPSDLLNHTLNGVCEQSWHSEDGRLLADPSAPETLSDPAVSVSSDRLVTSRCVNVLHEILCDAPGTHHRLKTMFRVRNETAVTPNSVRNETAVTPNSDVNEVTPSLQNSDPLWWLFPLFIFIFIIIICFILRKRIFRCFQREARFICQTDDDPDNRDLEVGSDDPHSPIEHQTEC